ncbi:MAG: hypothetical protein C7B44_09805 [Sulfobacillus thermosulfidooxidans]|nr:hypothetical protein CO251_15125 [Sulfobacillus sp. hq2]PSR36293.1 MAG: hypothetical protein C7B44_09805 [Sulfobacillus thermosulfidooxidans]
MPHFSREEKVRPISQVRIRNHVPYQFFLNGQSHKIIRIMDYWRDVSEWWRGEPELWFWRVLTDRQGVYELVCHPQSNQWWVYHVYD